MTDTVPVIDLSPLFGGGDGRKFDTVAAAIADACRRWGFFQVVNHGIPDPLVERVWRECRRFFALPMAEKRALLRSKENPRGYYDRELTKNARDLKEVFDIGLEPFPDLPSDHPRNRLPVDGYNQWPTSLPALKSTMTSYFNACENLGRTLLEQFCLGLGLRGDRLLPYFGSDHTSFVRLNHYPPCPEPAPEDAPLFPERGGLGVHHHTDAGALTTVYQDDVAGLQAEHDGEFVTLEPVPGALYVNLGDLLQVCSNDRYKAPLHRVAVHADRERFSAPFFLNPSYDTTYQPIPEALAPSEAPRYRPISWSHFRDQRSAGDYADYGDEIQISDYRVQAS